MELAEIPDADIHHRAGIDHAVHCAGFQQVINIIVFPYVACGCNFQATGTNCRSSIRRCIELHPEIGKLFSKGNGICIVIVFHRNQNTGRVALLGGMDVRSGGIIKIDAVFPVLHGKNGEDGTMQGLLEISGLPYVGCDTASSAVCMDKAFTNAMLDFNGIPQAKWTAFNKYSYAANKAEILKDAAEKLGFPIFVKPANAGSSVGISKANSAEELERACEIAFEHDSKLVLEEGIVGKEVECAVLGNEKPIASIAGEIVPCNDFYDYDAKYLANSSELHIPARLSEEKINEVRKAAVEAYMALGCSGFSRVDFFVRDCDGKILLNEINTIPGFTSISMYPKLFAASGIPYPELLDKLICYAMER